MANIDWPNGLRAVGNGVAGTAPRLTKYTRSSTGAIGEGAVVWLATTGPAAAASTTMDPHVLGVVSHFVGASDTEVYVYDDPEQEFVVQGDTAEGTPISVIGAFGNLINATTYNATTLQSKVELDVSELTRTRADGDILQVVRLWESEDNDQDAVNAKWVVKIYGPSHVFGANVAV